MPTKYLRKVQKKQGHHWALTPPTDYRRACDVRVEYFDDGRTARAAAIDLEKNVRAFRKGKLKDFHLNETSNLYQLRAAWLRQERMGQIAPNTFAAYDKWSQTVCDTPLRGSTVGDLRVVDVNHKLGSEIFGLWRQKRPHTRDNLKKAVNMMFKYAASQDLTSCIPMQYVTVKLPRPRQVIWTRKEVDMLVKECMSSFKTRNVGLLIIMCYEWAQRPIDIRNLKWDNINFETDTVTITQTKRGTTVYLPMDDSLKKLLLAQQVDFGFQPLVVPYLRHDKVWAVYSIEAYTKIVNQIKEKLGLPEELKVGDLRKTAVTEMVEAGLTEINIKPVTGHKSLQSITPYVKHTRSAAAAALHRRRENRDEQ